MAHGPKSKKRKAFLGRQAVRLAQAKGYDNVAQMEMWESNEECMPHPLTGEPCTYAVFAKVEIDRLTGRI